MKKNKYENSVDVNLWIFRLKGLRGESVKHITTNYSFHITIQPQKNF